MCADICVVGNMVYIWVYVQCTAWSTYGCMCSVQHGIYMGICVVYSTVYIWVYVQCTAWSTYGCMCSVQHRLHMQCCHSVGFYPNSLDF